MGHAVGGGFGPSTGRTVKVNESMEARLAIKTNEPIPLGGLVFAVAFLGILSGMTLIHLDEGLLGSLILTLTAATVALLVIWAIRGRR